MKWNDNESGQLTLSADEQEVLAEAYKEMLGEIVDEHIGDSLRDAVVTVHPHGKDGRRLDEREDEICFELWLDGRYLDEFWYNAQLFTLGVVARCETKFTARGMDF